MQTQRAKLNFGGQIVRRPTGTRKCECCGIATAQRTPLWLTSRWTCQRCADRYLMIEERARMCGVERLPYVAPIKAVVSA